MLMACGRSAMHTQCFEMWKATAVSMMTVPRHDHTTTDLYPPCCRSIKVNRLLAFIVDHLGAILQLMVSPSSEGLLLRPKSERRASEWSDRGGLYTTL
jgi:hypothetical protein